MFARTSSTMYRRLENHPHYQANCLKLSAPQRLVDSLDVLVPKYARYLENYQRFNAHQPHATYLAVPAQTSVPSIRLPLRLQLALTMAIILFITLAPTSAIKMETVAATMRQSMGRSSASLSVILFTHAH